MASQKVPHGLFATLCNAARVRDARIQDRYPQSWIREERENPVFPCPWSKKSRMDFLRPYVPRPG